MASESNHRLVAHFCEVCDNLIVRKVERFPDEASNLGEMGDDFIKVSCAECGTVFQISQVRLFRAKEKKIRRSMNKD